MREIKFRAWNGKQMIEQDNLIISGRYSGIYKNATLGDFIKNIQEVDTKCILMQFTGIKDCCGNDIYEGDIVEYEFSSCGNQIGEFVFIDGVFCLKNTNGYRPHVCEIIGNIHENPELIKK